MESARESVDKHCRACLSVEELMKRAREMSRKLKSKTTSESGDRHTDHTNQPSSSIEQNHSGASKEQENENRAQKTTIRADCPLDTEQLGKSTWNFLHTMAAYYPERPSEEEKNNARTMMNLLGKLYPCAPCAEGLRKDLGKYPPRVDSREVFSRYMCEMHNRVSEKLGKEQFDCSKWKERWLDGWKDGSCDY
ncbi:unnamed protein product [Anisakis simplex]|uniref:Sulfhydryl oxidase n=1 Tax=Anisakis simplex TaxID=6269 RepID=A0A0M3JT30_ANISI|nr:unnamed protein product [Anisakis simplex]